MARTRPEPDFLVCTRLDKGDLDELDRAAKSEDRSRCYMVRRILMEWLCARTKGRRRNDENS